VFWLDGSQRVPLSGVEVSATPLTDYTSAESDDLDHPPPAVPLATLSATSDGDGVWDLDGQLYGTTPYTFDSQGRFTDGSITVTVDDSGASASADGASATVTETSAGRFDVRLMAGNPRTLTGSFMVRTTDPGSVDFGAFTLTATSPTGQAIPVGA